MAATPSALAEPIADIIPDPETIRVASINAHPRRPCSDVSCGWPCTGSASRSARVAPSSREGRTMPHDAMDRRQPPPAAALSIDAEQLRPIVAVVVEEALRRLDDARATLPDKLAFTEAEAARLLSLHTHQLRDERLRGRIQASRIVGRQVRYLRSDLLDYLMADRGAA